MTSQDLHIPYGLFLFAARFTVEGNRTNVMRVTGHFIRLEVETIT